MNYSSSVSR